MDKQGRPSVFIGSSTEQAHLASAVKFVVGEQKNLDVRVWLDAFQGSETVIEGLMEALEHFEFGIFLLTDDDQLTIRGEKTDAPRDNVIFELGLFTGRRGRDHTFIILPAGAKVRRPSDLLGSIVGRYELVEKDSRVQDYRNAVREAAETARQEILATIRREAETLAQSKTSAGAQLEGKEAEIELWGTTAIGESSGEMLRAAAQAGALEALGEGHVRVGAPVVDDLAGLGKIIQIGPRTDDAAARLVVVEFRNGSKVEVQVGYLKEPKFRPRVLP